MKKLHMRSQRLHLLPGRQLRCPFIPYRLLLCSQKLRRSPRKPWAWNDVLVAVTFGTHAPSRNVRDATSAPSLSHLRRPLFGLHAWPLP
jgi:hypothetical protein